MRQVFVDTSAWAALADQADSNHEVALLFQDEIAGQCQFLATDYVLDELYTLLLKNIGYANAISFKRDLDVLRAPESSKWSGFRRIWQTKRGGSLSNSTWTRSGRLPTAFLMR